MNVDSELLELGQQTPQNIEVSVWGTVNGRTLASSRGGGNCDVSDCLLSWTGATVCGSYRVSWKVYCLLA